MKYKFYQFTLDEKKQTLYYRDSGGEVINIDITNINYQVLLFFIQHQSEVVTKDQIVDVVWQGKMVTDNSIDQSISKIRKSLAQYDKRVVIKTAYGKGLEFAPQVTLVGEASDDALPRTNQKKKNWIAWVGSTTVVVLLLLLLQFSPQFINQPKAGSQTPVMWLSNENNSSWLDESSHQLLNQLFTNNINAYLLNSEDKPEQLSNQEYIENYWRINPELEVIKTQLQEEGERYTLKLEIARQAGSVTESFSGMDLLKVLTESNQWLAKNSGISEQQSNSYPVLLPQDSHVLELYLRSLHAYGEGELDQALNYIQLAIDQEPGFDLARLQLAHLQNKQGNNKQSLVTLDNLKNSTLYDQLEIAAESLRIDILHTAGKNQEAIEIYQQLMDKYAEEAEKKLLPVKLNMSYTLTSLERYDEALDKLDEIITALKDQSDLDLMADAWHKKGSILLQIGETAEAKEAANLAYQHFSDLSDMMSLAKVNSLLARIAIKETDYQQAVDYLQQAIGVYRRAEYPRGVGATLNELIFILMVNGQFTQAWTHMLEMRQIALDIDYFAMLMAAKQFEIEISRARDQWVQAETGLADYFRLATENNYSRGLSKHQLFELDLALDQGQAERAQPIIKTIQQHINNSGEKSSQPRLNIQQARVYFLQDQPLQAIDLLNQTKAMALLMEDMEAIHETNNELLQHYVEVEDFSSAQTIIAVIDQSSSLPLAYPYLLLKSKVFRALGEREQALELAEKCKSQSNEFWRPKDEMYLADLKSN